MKNFLVFILLAGSLFAAGAPAHDKDKDENKDKSGPAIPAACASRNASFEVKLDDAQHTLLPPEPGKARIYFIQDQGFARCLGDCLTMKMGLDGTWVGANRNSSYFSVSVEAGEHHVCANPQSRFASATRYVALAHFTAEAGKVYFFRTRRLGDKDYPSLDLVPVDSDQAEYLIASYPLSVSRLKQ